MLHAQIGCREGIYSRLLVVRSQIASLTPGPSFAHNLGFRCPNCQCEGIFDIYVSRPFQRHQEHPNERCFAPCCRTLNIRESRRTPNPQLFQVLGFTPTLGQSGVATQPRSNGNIHVDSLAISSKNMVILNDLHDIKSNPNLLLMCPLHKLKKSYDCTKKFQLEWVAKLLWAIGVLVIDGVLHNVKCKVCTIIDKKPCLLTSKWDTLMKHEGMTKA